MKTESHGHQRQLWLVVILAIALISVAAVGLRLPGPVAWIDGIIATFRGSHPGDEHDHEPGGTNHDGHGHASHSGATSLEISAQGLRNVGLSADTLRPVQLETFRKSITVPGIIVERPGHTRVQVATPMTGVITHVHVAQGEAVEPGTLLFRIRLTHEDLVSAQTEFVKTLGELEVEEREIIRLKEVTRTGAVAGKLLLDREYARDKLMAVLRAQREALRLHGLSAEQVQQIESERRLLRELQITAPTADSHDADELKLSRTEVQPVAWSQPAPDAPEAGRPGPLVLSELVVHKGQSVNAGETLCVLSHLDELFIEGMAFEQDVTQIRQASEREWTVSAMLKQPGAETEPVHGLKLMYLANAIDEDSRTLRFYVRLPNQIAKTRHEGGHRYVEWKYLPGQRLQLQVPVEEWPEQIVLPVGAVAREGAESFVFQQDGDHFDRIPVHVKHRDQYSVVIENDGSLFPGDVVAMRGAHQLQMALKNKSGGGVDPHAGHNH